MVFLALISLGFLVIIGAGVRVIGKASNYWVATGVVIVVLGITGLQQFVNSVRFP